MNFYDEVLVIQIEREKITENYKTRVFICFYIREKMREDSSWNRTNCKAETKLKRRKGKWKIECFIN